MRMIFSKYQAKRMVTACIVAASWTASLLTAATMSNASADSPWPHVVNRTTDDRDLDLVNALVQRGRFDEAAQLCIAELKRSDPESDEAAKWAIRHSDVLSKQRMTAETFDKAAVIQAQQPIADLLAAYPDHRRRLFLKSQSNAVTQDAAKHDVVIAAISLSNSHRVDAAFVRLLRATTATSELSEEIHEAQSILNVRETDLAQKALSRDLLRLERELQIDVVSMALLQTELFAPDSRDQSTAANKAERLALDTLGKLPSNSRARLEIERLRVESMLRGGAIEKAEQNLAALIREVGKPIPARIQAMMVNIDLAMDRVSQAGRRIDAFYANQAGNASIEMDLAKLDWLIRQGDTEVSDWLDSIERRHGAYARRRAEAISLSNLSPGSKVSALDPSIVAAQGKEWLRRDNPARAGELLSAAARAESDASRAIIRASEAAAALIKAKRIADASRIMAEIAIKNQSAPKAAAAHLQASLLLASAEQVDAAKKIESLLKQTSETWPKSKIAIKARTWLLEILGHQKRKLDAAKMATAFLEYDNDPQKVSAALDRWIDLANNSEPEATSNVLQQFEAAYQPLLMDSFIAERYFRSATYLLDRSSLSGLPENLGDTGADSFVASLLAFRRGTAKVLNKPPGHRNTVTRWRLMRDAQQNPSIRKQVAAVLKTWGSDSLQDEATILVWNGEIDQAVNRIAQAAKDAKNAGEIWRNFANTLTSADSAAANKEAIKVWDRLASGLPKGSQGWHEAKLAAISLLAKEGNKQESRRRAKYILLTNTPADPELLRRYESASN